MIKNSLYFQIILTPLHLVLCFSLLLIPLTRAAIIFEDLDDIVLSIAGAQGTAMDIDIDGDGSSDMNFRVSGVDFSVFPEEGVQIFGIFEAKDPFAQNFEIGSLISSTSAENGQLLPGEAIFSSLIPTNSTPILSGEFLDEGYMGFSITSEGEPRYGWFHVTSFASAGGILHRFAIDNIPSVGIRAGSVPEPSPTMLACIATIAPLLRQRSRSSLS